MMDLQQSQSVSLDISPVEGHDLHRLMAEVLDLREKVASLSRSKRQRAGQASDLLL